MSEKTSTSGMSVEEMTESLTGFDEIAVEKTFGLDPYRDGETKPIGVLRALVFVHLRRGGKSDPEAKQAVLEMRVRDVYDYFEADDEIDPEDPVTEVGKDATPPD